MKVWNQVWNHLRDQFPIGVYESHSLLQFLGKRKILEYDEFNLQTSKAFNPTTTSPCRNQHYHLFSFFHKHLCTSFDKTFAETLHQQLSIHVCLGVAGVLVCNQYSHLSCLTHLITFIIMSRAAQVLFQTSISSASNCRETEEQWAAGGTADHTHTLLSDSASNNKITISPFVQENKAVFSASALDPYNSLFLNHCI